MRRVLVTGSSGFIGGRVLQYFQDAGWNVLGIGRRRTNQENYLACDLSRPFSPAVVDRISEVEVVVHCAARSSPWGTWQEFEAANINATANLLDFCQRHGHPRLIFISSSSVYYQECDQFNINEATQQASPPINHYAASKQKAEQLIRVYAGPYAILRPRAVYGRGDTVLFPRILRAAHAGRLPLLVRPGAPAVGDLISIHNLVHYIYAASVAPETSGEFNLTDDHPVEILEFLLTIFERLGIPAPKRRLSVRRATFIAGLIERLYAVTMPSIEPPITRFGVHVFAYSKTFDVTKMKSTWGIPPWSTTQAVDDFVNWVQTCQPYK